MPEVYHITRYPHKCPVCDGEGLVNSPPHLANEVFAQMAGQPGLYTCRACNGTGIVWEKEKDDA